MVSKKVFLSGKVQGVGFRYHAHEQATRLCLMGWIKNLSDGRVEMLLTGEETNVNQMIKWVHKGPPAAKVEKVEVLESKESAKEVFSIRRDGEKH